MDNFRIDVTGEGDDLLQRCVDVAFVANRVVGTYARSGTRRGVSHYAIRQPTEGQPSPSGEGRLYGQHPRPLRLVLFDRLESGSGELVRLPFRLDVVGAADFARRWLEVADYPDEPSIDGSCKRGWRVYNENWGHVDGDPTAVVAVAPAWALYGK